MAGRHCSTGTQAVGSSRSTTVPAADRAHEDIRAMDMVGTRTTRRNSTASQLHRGIRLHQAHQASEWACRLRRGLLGSGLECLHHPLHTMAAGHEEVLMGLTARTPAGIERHHLRVIRREDTRTAGRRKAEEAVVIETEEAIDDIPGDEGALDDCEVPGIGEGRDLVVRGLLRRAAQ